MMLTAGTTLDPRRVLAPLGAVGEGGLVGRADRGGAGRSRPGT
jgi:hypothetical protein